jgi:hypothetical protein
MTSMLMNIPESVQLSILSFLPAASLARVACVNRNMNEAARTTAAMIVSWLQQQHFPSSNVHLLASKCDKVLTALEIATLREMTSDRIVCVGGAYSEYSVAQLCMRSGAWSSAEEASTARDGSELVSYGGCLYSVGGEGDSALRSVDRFDLFRNQWSKCSTLLRPLRQSAALAVEDKLVIVGGEDAESSVVSNAVTVAKFTALNSSASNAFTLVGASLNHARKGHAAVVYNDKLWIAGGMLGDGSISASVETIDLDDLNSSGSRARINVFEIAPSMTAARKNFKLVVVRGTLYAVGGDSTGTIEAYDEYTNSWMLETAFPNYRRYFSVCVYNDKICVFGGQDRRSQGLKCVDVYDVAESEWGVDCSKATITASVSGGAGSSPNNKHYRPRTGSFYKFGDDKDKQSDKVSIRGKVSSSLRDSRMILDDFASGFVCGQSIALSFAQLTWSC